jgi:hypothetical protein
MHSSDRYCNSCVFMYSIHTVIKHLDLIDVAGMGWAAGGAIGRESLFQS